MKSLQIEFAVHPWRFNITIKRRYCQTFNLESILAESKTNKRFLILSLYTSHAVNIFKAILNSNWISSKM